jgi:hypothetical protein
MAKALSRPWQSLRNLIPFRKPIVIKRSVKTHLKEQGWILRYEKGKPQLEGWYRSKYGSFYGMIQNLDSTRPSYFIKDPPKELDSHLHRACFTERPNIGKGWYSCHFSTLPRDLDSGVLHLEGVLNESFRLAKKTA